MGAVFDRRVAHWLVPTLGFVLLYSLLPHKVRDEAQGWTRMWQRLHPCQTLVAAPAPHISGVTLYHVRLPHGDASGGRRLREVVAQQAVHLVSAARSGGRSGLQSACHSRLFSCCHAQLSRSANVPSKKIVLSQTLFDSRAVCA